MALASGKKEVKCMLGLWLLQTQGSLKGGYSFSCKSSKHPLASVGPDLLRSVGFSSSKTILELKLETWLFVLLEHLDASWTGLMLGKMGKSPINIT